MLLWQIIGFVLSITGIATLYLSWQRKRRSWPLVMLGWTLLLLSILSWAQTSGADKGPALGLVSITLVALVALASIAITSPVKRRRTARAPDLSVGSAQIDWRGGLRLTGKVLTLFFLCLIVSALCCGGWFMLCRYFGIEHTANLAITMMIFPLVWAGFAVFIGYSASLRNRVVGLMLPTIIALAILALNYQAGVA